MKLGRLEFGLAVGPSMWNFTVGSCNCLLLDLGPLYITWIAKDCKCAACDRHECECEDDENN